MFDVSIIIPTYNRLWSLPKAIKSCFETNLNVQVIVVDDGSIDGTSEWLKEQKKIQVITQPNQGKDWAVNNGFKFVKAKFVRFLDSDDWLLPYSTDLLLQKALDTNADIVCAGHEFYENEKLIKRTEWFQHPDFIAQQLGACDSSHYSAYLFKTDFVAKIPHRQEYGALDDRQFVIECALQKPVTAYVDKPTLGHLKHTQERLQNYKSYLEENSNLNARFKIYYNAYTWLKFNNELTQERLEVITSHIWVFAHWLSKRSIKAANYHIKWIYQVNPSFIPKEVGVLKFLFHNFHYNTVQKILSFRRIFVKHLN